MARERDVVVAGWGQVTQPKETNHQIKDPMGLMIEAAQNAAQKTTSKKVLEKLDGIMVVRTMSRHYENPDRQLASCLGANPRYTFVSGIGGNSPQTLINRAAGMIARNELDSVLIAGAETYVQREKVARVDSALFRGIPADYAGDDLIGATDLEKIHGMEHPMHGFPLFETALWADSGLSIDKYLEKVGTLWASFSETAARHPNAWSKQAKDAHRIITPGPHNRLVAFPYTKFMNSFVTVDQGAAVILMSQEKACQISDTNRRPVYFAGGGYARDSQRFMVEKSDFTVSPPLKKAVEKAIARSMISLEDLDCFDLYSCFPSAVAIARKMIGIADDDKRPLTLTGGLGFFGGPGNNYSLHSAVTLAGMISTGERNNGLITALGWFMHKHAAGIYSNRPVEKFDTHADLEDQENPLCGDSPVEISGQVNSTGIIETYTVIFSQDRQPAYAVLYGRTKKGKRFVARAKNDASVFRMLMSQNMTGRTVDIRFDTDTGMNTAYFI